MTAPLSPAPALTAEQAARDLRADLAAKLCGDLRIPDEVLSLIQQFADATAAAELRSAADEIEGESSHAYDEDDEAYEDSARRLRTRAAALDPEVRTSHPTAGHAFGSPEYLAALATLDATP